MGLAESDTSTQLAEPSQPRLAKSQATTILEEPLPESPKLEAETTSVAIGTDTVQLVKGKSTTVLKQPKQPAIRLSKSKDSTQLDEPVSEEQALDIDFSSIKLKEPIVKFEPVKLCLTKAATVLDEPSVKLTKSKNTIKIKQPL